MEKKQLGTLYCDGKAEPPGLVCKDSRRITIGSTVPGKELATFGMSSLTGRKFGRAALLRRR